MGITVTLRGGSGDMLKSVYDADLDAKIDKAQTEDNIAKFLIPSGGIILWSGAISAMPSGFVICDGLNSTPDLSDRFVIHADADAAGTNNVGDTGGVSSHTLTINEMPAHVHDIDVTAGAGAVSNLADNEMANQVKASSGSAGGGVAHTNRDKYYALAYIMKT
jgi:microcystin-dependent protein